MDIIKEYDNMSVWLKKIEPVTLYQSSEIPYVIRETGILLCFNNLFSSHPENFNQYTISFQAHKNQIKRQNTNFFKLNSFPALIELDPNTEVGNIIKQGEYQQPIEHIQNNEWQKIAIISDKYINHMREQELKKFILELKLHDYSFIAHSHDIGPKVRYMSDYAIPTWHYNWHRTLAAISDNIIKNSYRGYNWTKQAGLFDIKCFGFDILENSNKAKRAINNIGINDSNFVWI